MRHALIALALFGCSVPIAEPSDAARPTLAGACPDFDAGVTWETCPDGYTLACATGDAHWALVLGGVCTVWWTGAVTEGSAEYGARINDTNPRLCGEPWQGTCTSPSGEPWTLLCVPDVPAIGCPPWLDAGP